MRTSALAVGVGCLVVGAFTAPACSSSSNGSGAATGSQAACLASHDGAAASTACTTCVENSCASQLSAAEAGCGDFINCLCPGGSSTPNAGQTCTAEAQESSCTSATPGLSSCISANCDAACNGDGGGGDNGSSGSGGSSGSSGGGSGGSSGSGSGGSSGSSGSSGSGSSGSSGSGGAPEGGAFNWSCSVSFNYSCMEEIVPASAIPSLNSSCTASMGTPGTSCPTAGVQGCCVEPDETTTCYYNATIASVSQPQCKSPDVWQAGPP